MKIAYVAAAVALLLVIGGFAVSFQPQKPFVKAFYDSAPRDNGTIDAEKLIRTLSDGNANTYNFLMRRPSDFESLKELLPLAAAKDIDIWVTLIPPSELSPEQRNDPAYTDYNAWAEKLAKLSLEHENLKAWSIDNVVIDSTFFTPQYLGSMLGKARDISPKLMFIPVVYYQNVISDGFAEQAKYFDGVQFYYMHFPGGPPAESDILMTQLQELRKRFGGIVVLGLYATPWSQEFPTSADYVQQLINLARQHTDGVMIYTLNPGAEKFEVIRQEFA
ncbi:MAG: hypothetical protein J7K54_03090 [Candidatus Aenigmarchaeota archaeon]|nr:hypothetical protein [Candidatus Aenigmarchaeota archaeon]